MGVGVWKSPSHDLFVILSEVCDPEIPSGLFGRDALVDSLSHIVVGIRDGISAAADKRLKQQHRRRCLRTLIGDAPSHRASNIEIKYRSPYATPIRISMVS